MNVHPHRMTDLNGRVLLEEGKRDGLADRGAPGLVSSDIEVLGFGRQGLWV